MKIATMAAALAVLAGAGTAAYAWANTPNSTLRFRDYAEGIDQSAIKDLESPVRTSTGTPATPGVVSKWNQPRDVGSTGTTPHQGVDLTAAVGTLVYPVMPGWITYQHGKNTSGVCCTTSGTGSGNYEMIIRLDWNRNGVQDDNVYLKFDHLERVGYFAAGAYVSTADRVATSGNENGAYDQHLHFGFLYPKEGTSNTGRWTGNEPHYTWAADWNYGGDLDFISWVMRYSDNTVEATAYTMNTRVRSALPQGNVVLYHRRSGTSTWSAPVTMTALSSPAYRFRTSLNTLGYAPGTTIDWMVRAIRPNLAEIHPAAFFPAGPAHSRTMKAAVFVGPDASSCRRSRSPRWGRATRWCGSPPPPSAAPTSTSSRASTPWRRGASSATSRWA
jgi:hypothetical protein